MKLQVTMKTSGDLTNVKTASDDDDKKGPDKSAVVAGANFKRCERFFCLFPLTD